MICEMYVSAKFLEDGIHNSVPKHARAYKIKHRSGSINIIYKEGCPQIGVSLYNHSTGELSISRFWAPTVLDNILERYIKQFSHYFFM